MTKSAIETTIKELIRNMTLDEKAGMCSGLDFWHTKAVERLGIPSVMVSDGPYGLRKQNQEQDCAGVNDSIKAVCFPAGCLTTCSFDPDLIRTEGEILGDECQAEDVSVILGPAVNIKRSPLCGRNFEYFSEDPYLAGKMAAAYIRGVQSRNVGTALKHFAANNQEYRRLSCSSEVDERTLREIYLPAFEIAVKESQPQTVMCSYNLINGTYASENKRLLTGILRNEWKFKGYVMSDWGAVNDRVSGLKAGLDLEMPSSGGETDKEIVAAVKNGTLKESVLDKSVGRILKQVFYFTKNRRTGNFDKKNHHELAARIAQESMVLLKNDDAVLPLDEKKAGKILFVGEFAEKPRFEGGGSSHINSSIITSALDEAQKQHLNVHYEQGYSITETSQNNKLAEEALKAAREAETVVIFAGLPDSYESEGYDRAHMSLPAYQNALIEAVAKVQPNTVVVLHNGAPVEMPWVNAVKGILESYLGGEAVGTAQINLLFGRANPCGKLAETFPLRIEDTPTYLLFPGDGSKAFYREGIFIGYRYYDKKKMNVLFPFGFGLSYTTFKYSALSISKTSMKDTDTVEVGITVTNTGSFAGKEIIQLYVSDETKTVIRPEKELKGFAKIFLKPGESKNVTMTLDKRSFAWYSTKLGDWYVPTGDYKIFVGSSSRTISQMGKIHIESTVGNFFRVTRNTVMADILAHPAARKVAEPYITTYLKSLGGGEQSRNSKEAVSDIMANEMFAGTPLRALRSFAGISNGQLDEFIALLNSAVEN